MARTLLSAPPTDRVGRYPKHPFQIQSLPFTLQPFFFAPVLPGETMNNLYMESRVITDPINSPIIGWKQQQYFFYVRVTDLLHDAIRDMFVDPTNTDLSATLGVVANDQAYYTAKGGIDYAKRATQRVWETYFSDDGDTFASKVVSGVHASVNGVPFVQIRDRIWLDSITDDDNMPEGAAISTATDAGDLERLQMAYQNLLALGIANMTYEDFLRGAGISIPNKDEAKPELLAMFGDWQYPSNTIDPATGTPSSACSWVFKNSMRDPKMFKEPGFVIGFSVTRPKIYFGGLAGNLTAHLSRTWDWLPWYLNEGAADPMVATSLKRFLADTGPLGDRTTATDEYWVDMRDLFVHGDQWQNRTAFNAVPADVGSQNILALPPGDNHHAYKYLSATQCKSFFVDTATNHYIRQDGYVSLSVMGKQVDYTVGNFAEE